MSDPDKLKQALQGVGASKIIYSLVMPETEAVKRKVLRGDSSGEMPQHPSDIHKYLQRPADGHDIMRVCLTPTMAETLGMAKTHEVAPRYYEGI